MTEKLSVPLKRKSKSSFRAKRSLTFNSPSTIVSYLRPSLSPAHSKTSTDRALTFLQSARDRNVPVRFGKWSRQEDAYLEKLITLFQSGLLAEIETKTSLRSWLAQMLNCCPMRISKKQMHGHQFEGKAKYKRSSSNVDAMTQGQYDDLCNELWHLRAEFLKAWAKDEYGKRSAKIRTKDTNFNEWYDRVLRLVPAPKVAKRSSLNEFKRKRQIESLDELRREMHDEAKRQKVEMLVEIRATNNTQKQRQDMMETMPLEPFEIVPLDPTSLSFSSTVDSSPTTSAMTALPTAYCSESMGEWLTDIDDPVCVAHLNDNQRASRNTNEPRYTFCEDQLQVSVQLHDQQHDSIGEVSMSRKSSRLVLDFGAPSCWYTDQDSDQTSFGDYSHWTDNDLTEELSISMEPGIFGWDDSSPIAHMTYSPTLNFL
ncbi:unnamed protein product [Peronospora belbahrii]|uniref:Uncharacterized protein n=1 Tax=Peronospora belbahrii TaxID=622444 RepID=A0AAU9KXS7_9STRA|nr:unnamed protein product [Peronospora belbahrii]CAH0520688.1 unnamed protein product [Peronospora belbahrii]